MGIIKEVKINNYKGIENIQFPCGSINIIVGPNNTGKSSLLESIIMSISSLNNFEDINEIKLSDIFDFEFEDIKYIIKQKEEKSTIKIELLENDEITLDLVHLENGYPLEIEDEFLNFINKTSTENVFDSYRFSKKIGFSSREFDRLSRDIKILEKTLQDEDISRNFGLKRTKLENTLKLMSERLALAIEEHRNEAIDSEKLFIISKLNKNLIGIYAVMDESIGQIPFKNNISTNIPLIISTPKVNYGLHRLYKKLVTLKKLRGVIDTLKNRIPYFEDITEIEGGLVVSLEDMEETLPLYYMGDGFKALIKLSFMAPLVKNGVVIFEEPEVSMHPAYVDILASEIVINSENSQFFITTHSLEVMKSIIEKAVQFDKIDSIKIIKMNRLSEGYIEREILSGIEAKEEMDIIETDLRGF